MLNPPDVQNRSAVLERFFLVELLPSAGFIDTFRFKADLGVMMATQLVRSVQFSL